MGGISLNGLASGLDTNAIVESLMKLERKPYEALETKYSVLQEKQSVIREINTKLSALRTAASDLMYSTSFNLTSAKVADSSVIQVTSTDSAAVNSYNVTINQLAKKHVVSSLEFAEGGNALAGLAGETISFSGKGDTTVHTFTLAGATDDEILTNLMTDINEADVGVTASVIETSPGNKTLILTSDEYGTDADMEFGTNADPDNLHTFIDATNPVLIGLGLKDGGTLAMNTKQAAQNAEVDVNGVGIVHTDNTLNDVIEGVTIELLKEGASSTFDIAKDTEQIADKVETFVNAYNEAIELIRTHSAKGGLLQGDSTLRSLQDELGGILNAEVANNTEYKYLVSIGLEVDKGITTGSEMTGKISFDRDTFIEALNDNPEEVYNLFAYDDQSVANDDGIGMRFNESLYEWTKFGTGLLAFKIDGYDSQLENVADQMERLELRLQNKEQQMLEQFAAMENALMSLRNEQSWLTGQLNSLMA